MSLGDHTIYAQYLGDSNHAPASSSALVETIESPPVADQRRLPRLVRGARRRHKCWGDNTYGQLGHGSTDVVPHPTPSLVPGLTNVIDRERQLHTCAVLAGGAVKCWGYNRWASWDRVNGECRASTPTSVVGLPGPANSHRGRCPFLSCPR